MFHNQQKTTHSQDVDLLTTAGNDDFILFGSKPLPLPANWLFVFISSISHFFYHSSFSLFFSFPPIHPKSHPSILNVYFFTTKKKSCKSFQENIEFLMKFCKQHLLIKLYYLVDVTSLFPVLYVAFCIEPAKYIRSQFACWAWWQKLCNIAVALPRWNFSFFFLASFFF